jgi:GR25 family glycosyltransferase involved in LPS biosynthesis
MMKTLVITLNDEPAFKQTQLLRESAERTKSEVDIQLFQAITPETIDYTTMFGYVPKWTWPVGEGSTQIDYEVGILKKGYRATNNDRVIACALSHIKAWKYCLNYQETMLILEQDALFTDKFVYEKLQDNKKGVISINSPIGATRKGRKYDHLLKVARDQVRDQARDQVVFDIPDIDDDEPSPKPANGLPGNSAYILKPKAAQIMLTRIHSVGLWPNDAYLCKQIFPFLGVAYPYYTKVQGTQSTTTL